LQEQQAMVQQAIAAKPAEVEPIFIPIFKGITIENETKYSCGTNYGTNYSLDAILCKHNFMK
jgi:hypothetical protein